LLQRIDKIAIRSSELLIGKLFNYQSLLYYVRAVCDVCSSSVNIVIMKHFTGSVIDFKFRALITGGRLVCTVRQVAHS